MKMRIKPSKYVKLYGFLLESEQSLTDAECRLFYVILRIVRWDPKHVETFGSVGVTIREIKEWFLPDWSIGSISETLKSLISKGWIYRRPDKRLAVRNYEAYRAKSVQAAEQILRVNEQTVQKNEQNVQSDKQIRERGLEMLRQGREKLLGKMSVSVHHIEQEDYPKKLKEI